MPVALIYRWKNAERADGFVMRGRGQHRILDHSLRALWSTKQCEDALAAIENSTNPDQVPFQIKSGSRASLVLTAFEADPNNLKGKKNHILTSPLQHCLNAAFKADRLSCKLASEITMDPHSPATEQAKKDVFKINMSFFSGKRGHEVQADYMEMITDLNCDKWFLWQGSYEKKLESAASLIRPMSQAWRRTVVPYEWDDIYRLLSSFESAGSRVYDRAKIQGCAELLEAKKVQCPGCLNPDFTLPLLPLVQQRRTRLLFNVGTSTVIHARINSGIVERSHLPGQELKSPKSRGLALDGQALQVATYRRSVAKEGGVLKDAITEKVMKAKNMVRGELAAFTKAQTFSVGRKNRGVQQQMWKKQVLGGVRKYGLRRETDGHKVCRRANWSVRAPVGSAEFKQEDTRIAAAWVALSPEERAL